MIRRTSGRIVAAAATALVVSVGCVRQVRPRPVAEAAQPPLPSVSFDRPGTTAVLARNAYVRVQAEPGTVMRMFATLPIIGDFFANFATSDVTTLDFTRAFTAKSDAFLARLCPACTREPAGAAGDRLRMELTLARTTYHRRRKELSQLLTFRVIGQFGTVIYSKVVAPTASGDVLAEPALLDRTLDDGFALLAEALRSDYPRILDDLAFHDTDIRQLEEVLLARSRALGRAVLPGGDGAGRRWAVVIGVSAYQSPGVTQLQAAAGDARAVFHAFNAPENRLGFGADQIVLLPDEAATRRNVREALSRWLAHGTRAADTVVVYFSGHGIYSENLAEGQGKKEKYFLPVDYDPARNPYDTAIPMQEIIDYFERLSAENVVMIFDACHAGAAALDDRTDELQRFARVKAMNRLNTIIAAAKPHQISWELGSHGLFTKELEQGLLGGADLDADGTVTVAEVARYLEAHVREESLSRGLLAQEPVWQTNRVERAERLPLAAFARREAAR